jgi:cyclopropane fatty-acyl-phospholipid synthase-like methyltransferase
MACIGALSQTQPMLTLSEACERNKGPILEVLRTEFAASRTVLEVGSGTGQHARYFATQLPHLSWQPSELAAGLAPLAEHLRHARPAGLRPPVELDVQARPWPVSAVDAVFSANTLHIMSWSAVRAFFGGVASVLSTPGVLCVYGPFNYHGRYTSDSNAQFDAYLKARDPLSGIRDFEALDELAAAEGLMLAADHAMPANNRTLVWHRSPVSSDSQRLG